MSKTTRCAVALAAGMGAGLVGLHAYEKGFDEASKIYRPTVQLSEYQANVIELQSTVIRELRRDPASKPGRKNDERFEELELMLDDYEKQMEAYRSRVAALMEGQGKASDTNR